MVGLARHNKYSPVQWEVLQTLAETTRVISYQLKKHFWIDELYGR